MLTALKNHRHHQKGTMRFLPVFTICVLCTLVVSSKDANETVQKEGVLMKNISDLHFQLFSSIQKKAKMIKVFKKELLKLIKWNFLFFKASLLIDLSVDSCL